MGSSAIVDFLTPMPTSKKQSTPEVIENIGSLQGDRSHGSFPIRAANNEQWK